MAETTLAKKLGIKPGYRVLILNAPDGYKIDPLPEGVEIAANGTGPFDVVQVFVHSQADVNQHAAAAIRAVKPGGLLWLTYPKISSKVKTDLTRDTGWDGIRSLGWEGVSLIAVDSTWSAMRYRPQADVKSRK